MLASRRAAGAGAGVGFPRKDALTGLAACRADDRRAPASGTGAEVVASLTASGSGRADSEGTAGAGPPPCAPAGISEATLASVTGAVEASARTPLTVDASGIIDAVNAIPTTVPMPSHVARSRM
jgi:hypothetical protein